MQYVQNVQFCKKYPIYGYSEEKQNFLKIEMYDYFHVKMAANILREGGVYGI